VALKRCFLTALTVIIAMAHARVGAPFEAGEDRAKPAYAIGFGRAKKVEVYPVE
jgi:hypothetical protein